MTRPAEPARRKPRLVFFQFRYDPRLPRFLLTQKDDHVRCLRHGFDVTVVSEDCDYDAVCDTLAPELALFESGVPNPQCRRLRITRTRSHPGIPKLGLLNADAFCQGREGFLSDMHEWGIDTFFTIATAALDFNRELEGRLFAWPNAIDPAIYRDYGGPKHTDVLFTGNTGPLYPWRRRMLAIVAPVHATTVQRHNGYAVGAPATKVGEAYARLIGGARVVPSCGTVAHEIVRKHFEIPACMSCLVTERTPALASAGFVDMVNCVFADEHDVLDRLAHLFAHPDDLAAITRAGHALVHARHTLRERDQIRQWFDLQRRASAGQAIEQPTAFAPLRLVAAGGARFPAPDVRPQLVLLAQGDAAALAGAPAAARALYLRCTRLVDYMPEPHLRLALCELQLGHAARALDWITRPLEFTLATYGAARPDPVAWATYLLCLACLGRRREALRKARLFADLDHLALRRVRWLLAACAPDGPAAAPPDGEARPGDAVTIHGLPVLSTSAWIAQAAAMLRACGQADLARALQTVDGRAAGAVRQRRPESAGGFDGLHAALLRELSARARRRRLLTRLVDSARHGLHRAERRLGFFLPFRYSALRHEPFFQRLQEAFQDPAVHTARALSPVGGSRVLSGFLHLAAASGKPATLGTLGEPGAAAGDDGDPALADLLLVDCRGAAGAADRRRRIGAFASTGRYLFLVDGGDAECAALETMLAGHFGPAERAARGAGDRALVFRRRRAGPPAAVPPLSLMESMT